MFEKEIKYISDFNINKIRKLGAFFTLDGLASARVHPAIFQYISAELDYLFYRDRKSITKQSHFDYTLPEVAPHFNAIGEIIKQRKLLPFENIKELVVQAVQFNVYLLLRPKSTLSKFIFGDAAEKSTEEVQILLRYLYYYDFYRKVTSEFLEKKNILKFRYDEFESVINNLTKLLVESQTQAMIDTALTSMADFFNAGDVNKSLIPVAAVEMYLKEKNLGMYISKIRTILSTDLKRRFEVDDYKNAMYSNIAISLDRELREKLNQELAQEYEAEVFAAIDRGKFSFTSVTGMQAPEQEEIDYSKPSDLRREETTISLKELLDEQEGAESIYTKQPSEEPMTPQPDFASSIRTPEYVQPAVHEIYIPDDQQPDDAVGGQEPEKAAEPEIPPPLFTLNIPPDESEVSVKASEETASEISLPETPSGETIQPVLSQPDERAAELSSKDNTEQDEEERTRDLFSYFSARETMRIVEEIFNNDSLDFVSTMESVAECENFEQAQTLLKSVFYTYKINTLTSKEANLLSVKIEEYFKGGN